MFAAKCKCVAGYGESCSHVASVLVFLLNCKEEKVVEISETSTLCTSRLMSWHQTATHLIISAVEVWQAIFETPTYGKQGRDVHCRSLENFEPPAEQDLKINETSLKTLLYTLPHQHLVCFTSGIKS